MTSVQDITCPLVFGLKQPTSTTFTTKQEGTDMESSARVQVRVLRAEADLLREQAEGATLRSDQKRATLLEAQADLKDAQARELEATLSLSEV